MSMSEYEQIPGEVKPHIIAKRMLESQKSTHYLEKDYIFKTLEDTREILVYDHDRGIYIPHGEWVIDEFCKNEVPDCSKHFREEVKDLIRIETHVHRSVFDDEINKIVLLNGVYDLESGEFFEHSPYEFHRICIPVKYDPDAKCFNFLKFLEEVQPDEQERRVLLEEFACTLIRRPHLQKAFMHIGKGANGKSTFLGFIEKFLGRDNISNQSLHNLANNRFAGAELDAKLANIYADISDQELRHTGMIKILITGDAITVERKNRNPFKLQSYAKLFFSANKLPEVNDDSDAFFRRWIITNWDQKFEGSNADPNILQKISTEEEFSGLLNILLGIARELLRRGKFSSSPSTEQTRKEWLEKSDITGTFLRETVALDVHSWISKAELYEKYTQFCQSRGYTPRGIQTFNSKVQAFPSRSDTVKHNGKSLKVWRGITLKATTSTISTTPYSRKPLGNSEERRGIPVETVETVTHRARSYTDHTDNRGIRQELSPESTLWVLCSVDSGTHPVKSPEASVDTVPAHISSVGGEQ